MKSFRKIVCLLAFLFPISNFQCKRAEEGTSEREIYKSTYIGQFRLTYFQALLKKSYNNSAAVQEIIDLDHSGFTEPILTSDDYGLIDSLTTADNHMIRLDSANSIGRVAEGAEGKQPLGFILDKISSKWLDSLALKRYEDSGVTDF